MPVDVLRILDVNLNRAREALRVIEDYARFVRDDADAASHAKACRHDLRRIAEVCGPDALLAARDILGDVGRDTRTPTELQRDDLESVVRAAFGRLSEAARGLAEYGKIVAPAAAAAAEQLRYAAYELEQRIVLRGALRQRFRAVRLYVLVTESSCRGPWLATVEAALRGGADCVQLREKTLDGAELLRRARQLRELTRAHGALLAINDRPDIARLCPADILHVGQTDLSVADARHVAGAAILVGKSTHTPAQFDAAVAERPDYLAVGPMFDSPTKPQPHVAGPQTLAAVRPRTSLPLVAIGGITPDTVDALVAAGADVIAVCRAVIGLADPEAAARSFRQAIDAARARHRPHAAENAP